MEICNGAATEQLQIAVWQRDQHTVTVVLTGELDLGVAHLLRECLADLFEVGITNMVIDLANLRSMDSTGISVLVTALNWLRASGGALTVCNAGGIVLKVLQITGLVERLSGIPDHAALSAEEPDSSANSSAIATI